MPYNWVSLSAGMLISGDGEPWSFNLFSLGLDVILPKMDEVNWKVFNNQFRLINTTGHSTFETLLLPTATNVRTPSPTNT
jgi:hypothetical protein